MRKLLLPGVAVALLATSIAAQAAAPKKPAPKKLPPPPPSYSWEGFYGGVNAGYASGRDSVSQSLTIPACGGGGVGCAALAAFLGSAGPTLSPRGFTGGGQIGFNHQVNNWVFGVESDFGYLRLSDSFTFGPRIIVPGQNGTAAGAGSVTSDWLLTVRPRVGLVVDRLLVYATGGLAVSNQKYSSTVTVSGNPGFTGRFNVSSSTTTGWALGAGLEYAVDAKWTVRAEYLHLDFGSQTTTTANAATAGNLVGASLTSRSSLTADIGRVGVNLKFN
jgi:outer membrane immunogenic protein